jgi:NADH-quinone oxidoreductase subunit E
MVGSDQTRVDPVDPDALTDGMDASNDPIDDAAAEDDADAEQEEEPYDTPRDDLKKIKGVGPAIEKTLNEMGISRFDQIAQMSEYDIDRVAHRLKGFRSRIYREDWIGQARDLHDQKVGGP